jgi:hypothetical protein
MRSTGWVSAKSGGGFPGLRTLAWTTVVASVVWIAGCAAAHHAPDDLTKSSADRTAILELPRAASVDCRIDSLEPANASALPDSSAHRDRIALVPGGYRLVLACSRDVGTWWTPTGTETRHRFQFEAEAGRRYAVEMSNVSAGLLKWSELDAVPMIGRIVDAGNGATVAEEIPAGTE